MLPDCLVPYKHYNEETISGVLDDIVNPDDEDSEIYPSEKTMLRWHHWFILNQFNIEGHMKSIGYRLLGFKEELLKFSNSLLVLFCLGITGRQSQDRIIILRN